MQVQESSRQPLCPTCCKPVSEDFGLSPDYDLCKSLGEGEEAEEDSEHPPTTWEQKSPTKRATLQEHEPSQALTLNRSSSQSQSRRLIYDLPLPEETGSWIPVSIPPKGYKDSQLTSARSEIPGGGGPWYPERVQYEEAREARPEVNLWNVLNGFINIIAGKSITQMISEDTSTQTWPELAQRYSARSGLVMLPTLFLKLLVSISAYSARRNVCFLK